MLIAQTTRPLQKKRRRRVELLRQRFGLTRSMGVGQREKEGKEARKREQPGRTGATERRKAAEKRQERNNFVWRAEIIIGFEREERKTQKTCSVNVFVINKGGQSQ